MLKIKTGRVVLLVLIQSAVLLCAVARAQQPDLVVQSGHTNDVRSVAYSPDGRLLASAGKDNTVKLWEAATGQELRTLRGHGYGVHSVAFSADGKTLASGGIEDFIKLWDVKTGREIRALKISHQATVEAVAFSPDGKVMASGHGDVLYGNYFVKLWDTSSWAELRTIRGGVFMGKSLSFSRDGSLLAASSFKGLGLYDVASGRLIRRFPTHAREVMSVALSPDGRTLVSGSGEETAGTFSGVVKIFDAESGFLLRTIKTKRGVMTVAFSKDGTRLASGGRDYEVNIWDPATGQNLKEFKPEPGDILAVYSVAFSPDGKVLATGDDSNNVALWDVERGEKLLTFNKYTSAVKAVVISPDQRWLAAASARVGDYDIMIRLYNLQSGVHAPPIRAHPIFISALAFSPDSKILASSGSDTKVSLWDVATGRKLTELSGEARELAFSHDNKFLAMTELGRKTIKVWDVSSGQLVKTLTDASEVTSVAFSPDGLLLASTGAKHITLWDWPGGNKIRAPVSRNPVGNVAFSPDGKILASVSWGDITLSDARTGRPLKSYPQGEIVSAESKYKARNEVFALVPALYSGGGSRELVTADGRFHVVKGENGEVAFHDMRTGRVAVRLILLNESDWVAVTPEGLFDGTPEAWRQLNWVFDSQNVSYAPVEAFFKEFYSPGLLQEILQGVEPRPPKTQLAALDIRQPAVRITSVGGEQLPADSPALPAGKREHITLAREAEVVVEVTENNGAKKQPAHPAASGAQGLRLFRNGSLLKHWKGSVFDRESGCEQPEVKPGEPRRAICRTTLTVRSGGNKLTAYAFNHENVKSKDYTTITINLMAFSTRPATLHVLAVGVNEYANKNFNLTYAVPDAREFAAQLVARQQGLAQFARVNVLTLYDAKATKQSILDAFAALSTKMVQPEDAVVFYFAGHGTVGSCDPDDAARAGARGRFYLVPHDLGYEGEMPRRCEQQVIDQIARRGISDEELERAFEGVDAGQLLMVIDACDSGQALEAEEKRRGPMNLKGLAQLAYEKGMYILTAAQSYQAAKAASSLGHGYLTYALVEEGLKTAAADADQDRQVVLREWLDYAARRVPRMQEGSDEYRQLVQGGGGVQRPRVFYRREREARSLVVAKP